MIHWLAARESRTVWVSASCTFGNPSLWSTMRLLFHPVDQGIPRSHIFKPNLLPEGIQNCGQLAHSPHYIYYAVSYTIQLPAFSDINKDISSASKIM